MRVPLGVIGIIYESRPNVTADAAGLCIKSGNASIFAWRQRGDSLEPRHRRLHPGGPETGRPTSGRGAGGRDRRPGRGRRTQYHEVMRGRDRAARRQVAHRAYQRRGDHPRHQASARYLPRVHRRQSRSGQGDKDRVQRQDPSLWCVQRHGDTARGGWRCRQGSFRARQDVSGEGVELRGCAATQKILPGIKAATEDDWYTEYLAPILSIRVVENVDQAIEHIAQYGSAHTDSIVTEDITRARRFLREVDSSSVMVNASTRFADGFEYGLGAEIASPPTSCTPAVGRARRAHLGQVRGARRRTRP